MGPPESTQGGQKILGYITKGGRPLAVRVRHLGKKVVLGGKIQKLLILILCLCGRLVKSLVTMSKKVL
jgi:hypothetical protein